MVVINEDLFKGFAFWGSILIMKTLAMSLLTARQRFAKNVFANPEDRLSKTSKIVAVDEDVERVRRAHRNDLENILPWFVMTLIWLTTGPSYTTAMLLIRGFVLSRIVHTFVYAIWAKQPHRAIAWFIGYAITIYQAIATLIYYM